MISKCSENLNSVHKLNVVQTFIAILCEQYFFVSQCVNRKQEIILKETEEHINDCVGKIK